MAASDRDPGDGQINRAAGAPVVNAPANPPADSGPIPKLSEMPTQGAPAGSPTEAGDPPPHTPMPGERLGENDRFEIVEKLGAGGMGHVFRAIDWHLDRTVAIKFILQTGGMSLERLIAMLRLEAKATAKLNNENIVAIFDMDTYRGMPFLVMELLDGQSLDVMLERSQMSPLRATQIMTQVARGLSHAHANGIVHRDLKPSNVFILRDGRAKILDFGISRFEPLVRPTQISDAAPTMIGYGTPAFMAPEQLRGEPQDGRTDIWAAGVMFYQMLAGRLPYTVPELLLKFQTEVRTRNLAPSVRLLVPTLPEEAERLVATALNEDPQGRFQTAREMMEAFRELEGVIAGRFADTQVGLSAPQIERRPLTILACHLEGPDSLDLDDIVDAEQRFFYQAAVDAVKRADGCIGTPVGGKFFCCFGYPAVKGNDAQRAMRAALQVAHTMREHGPKGGGLDFKIGVHSGVVGLPSLPGAAQGIPAMRGNVPNIAARLAEAAPAGSVVMSQATFELTSGLFHTQAQSSGADGAPDKSRSPVYQVLGEVESSSRFEQAFSGQLTPFVGRDTDLAFLRQLWEDAKEGRGQIVVVSGEPGIGKSRFVQTLKDGVIEEQNIRLTCQCRPHFKNSALYPVIELIRRSMDIQRDDTPDEKLAKLEQSLAALGFALPEAVPLFGALLSIPFEPKHAPLGLPPEQQKMKTLEGLVSMLLRTALNRPTLFIIEDVHWVDHSTIEYLSALIDLLPSSRVLVVLTSRPEFHVPWSARRHLHQLTLDKLSPASALSIIEHASKDTGLSPEMIERLVATTDGVPLFVEELTRMVVESCQPTGTGQTASMAIPGTLHELLLARLDLLRGIGKEVAQVASILGRDFHYELLRHVSPVDEMSLQQGLEILSDAGILSCQGRPPESTYVFKHALIQQTAYQSLVKSQRERHHRRAAEVLSEIFKETAELQPELLAYHHGEAGEDEKAIVYLEKAGQLAARRSALTDAETHYRRALQLLLLQAESPVRDRDELRLQLALGAPLMATRGYANPEVRETYARARQLCQRAGDDAQLFESVLGLWYFYMVGGEVAISADLGHQLLAQAEKSPNPVTLMLAHRALGTSLMLSGEFQACREHTEKGFNLYDRAQHGKLVLKYGQDPGVTNSLYLAWSLWYLGFADQALHRAEQAVELSRALQHPLTIALALNYQALVHNYRGEHQIASTLAAEAMDIAIEHRLALWQAMSKIQHGWALLGLGERARGSELLKEGVDSWTKTGAKAGLTFFLASLVWSQWQSGALDDAMRTIEEMEEWIHQKGERFIQAELLRLRGEVTLLSSTNKVHEAEEHFLRGLEIARQQKARAWELRLVMSLGRLWARRGENDRARQLIQSSLAGFTEGLETADLKQARLLLQSL